MLKYAFIALLIVGAAYWWLDSRERAVRRKLREEERGKPELGMQKLLRCPRCGTYKVKGARCCDPAGTPRG